MTELQSRQEQTVQETTFIWFRDKFPAYLTGKGCGKCYLPPITLCFMQMKGSVCIAQSSIQMKALVALITLFSGPPCPSLDWVNMAVYFLRIH